MNLPTLLTPRTLTSMAQASYLRLPVLPSPRAIAGGLLLAATLATGLLAPQTRAQEEPVAQAQTVNINNADAEALSSLLSGIGQARAEAIVRYREMYGPFESIEELMDVSGVGEATLARNRERISLE
ncbi:MAG: helix-hairpin-helix domain-containing protein [Chromatocurvus sp.]